MSRPKKIALIVLGGLSGLLLLAVVAGLVVIQTQWFRDTVRQKIVAAVEDSTGGRAEIGSFAFDWHHLRAQIHNFVLHGSEPANVPPLFTAKLVQVDLKLTSPFGKIVDIAYLLADTPQANVIVYPDGTTNVPAPKIPHHSDKTGLETIVELAIGKFDLRNGSIIFSERKTSMDAHGENLRAELSYNMLDPSYKGYFAMDRLLASQGANAPVRMRINIPVVLRKDKVEVSNG